MFTPDRMPVSNGYPGAVSQPAPWTVHAVPNDITGHEAANYVLLEMRLGMVSPQFVKNWVNELRQEGFGRLAAEIEDRINLI